MLELLKIVSTFGAEITFEWMVNTENKRVWKENHTFQNTTNNLNSTCANIQRCFYC